MESTAAEARTFQSRFKNLDFNNSYNLFLSARAGINTKVFYDFAEAVKMPEKKLASLINISARTVSNYKEKRKALEPSHSEHLLKLIALYDKGQTIFGSIDELNYWLEKPFWNSKEKPMDWLNTSGGVDLVIEEIDRLAEGYPV